MGLPAALKAHGQGDLKTAAFHYRRALQQNDLKPVLFQNFGALLRDLGEVDKAEALYVKGLKMYPTHCGIRLNYANLVRSEKPLLAFHLQFALLQEKLLADSCSVSATDIYPVVDILESLQCYNWAYQICRWAIVAIDPHPSLLLQLFKIVSNKRFTLISDSQKDLLAEKLNKTLSKQPKLDQAEFYFALLSLQLQRHQFDESISTLVKARSSLSDGSISTPELKSKALKLNNVHSWNTGCTLLTHQQFEDGWKLFEYGLRAAAKGAQRWQRALPKPFTNDQCPVWRGQSLRGKSILLLEEQAIGDVMQFLTLLPDLINEADSIGLLLSNRLVPVYQRSFSQYISSNLLKIWTFDDCRDHKIDSSIYDYQSPLGSVCQYRFTNIQDYGQSLPILKADQVLASNLRGKYLNSFPKANRVIGISWRGGGRADRIKQKSVPLHLFSNLLKTIPDAVFVSLQYGDLQSALDHFREQGIQVFHDPDIDPLKNMDTWHSQIYACDAVISVANTTIHGAGGLNIPTQCLLSVDSDWRWLKSRSVTRSYWYPSVAIARQSVDNDWSPAFDQIRMWLDDRTPYPVGKQFE